MKARKFMTAVLLVGVAFSALTSCHKDDLSQPLTLPPSGEISNFTIATSCSVFRTPNRKDEKASILYLYSDTFPFVLLDGFKITIQALYDPNSLMFYHPDGDSVSHSVIIPKKIVVEVDKSIYGPGLLHVCDPERGSYMGICYKLPKSDCVIPFFLDIENSALGLKYRTQIYYYTISSHPNIDNRTYDAIF